MPPVRLDLLVVADSREGGLGAAAAAHADWFAEQGWAVALAAPGMEKAGCVRAQVLDLPAVASAVHVGSVLRAAAHLHKVLRRTRPRIVHAHGTRSQLVVLLAGGRPYVTMHGAGGRIEGQRAVGAAARRVGRQLAPRLAVKAYSAAPAGGRWETLLHASPRLAELQQLPPDWGDRPTFVWIGRLDAPKRPDLFVEACALAAKTVAVRGLMLGDGPMLDQVRSHVARVGAPIDVLGSSRDVSSRLREAWAVCLFSEFEGVPFSVQEAMWAGRAVVLSPLPSLRWFAGDTAAFAADAAAAADALLDLCDRDVAAARGAHAAEHAHRLLTADAPFPRLTSDYVRAMSSR